MKYLAFLILNFLFIQSFGQESDFHKAYHTNNTYYNQWLIKSEVRVNTYHSAYDNINNPKQNYDHTKIYIDFKPISDNMFISGGVSLKKNLVPKHVIYLAIPHSSDDYNSDILKLGKPVKLSFYSNEKDYHFNSIGSYYLDIEINDLEFKTTVYEFLFKPEIMESRITSMKLFWGPIRNKLGEIIGYKNSSYQLNDSVVDETENIKRAINNLKWEGIK